MFTVSRACGYAVSKSENATYARGVFGNLLISSTFGSRPQLWTDKIPFDQKLRTGGLRL
jgi:hypothetical protein